LQKQFPAIPEIAWGEQISLQSFSMVLASPTVVLLSPHSVQLSALPLLL
jgi:hypothetical protein